MREKMSKEPVSTASPSGRVPRAPSLGTMTRPAGIAVAIREATIGRKTTPLLKGE